MVAPIPLNLRNKKRFFYLLREEGRYEKVMHDIRVNFNIAHAINLIDRQDNYFNFYCFAAQGNNNKITDFYLNNINFLENFVSFFEEKASKLLQKCEKHKILLPRAMRSTMGGTVLQKESPRLRPHRIQLNGRYKHITFSRQQDACINYLLRGYTAKDIAKYLSLSPKTVEHYLENVKNKLGCNRKSEVIKIIAEYGSSPNLLTLSKRMVSNDLEK